MEETADCVGGGGGLGWFFLGGEGGGEGGCRTRGEREGEREEGVDEGTYGKDGVGKVGLVGDVVHA